ncbi:MAG: TIGR01620 family protein [Hyphomicrobiaceae bacterium]|nr:TIGR01620 family protein [Hyphomicrobiaceae bacterium]
MTAPSRRKPMVFEPDDPAVEAAPPEVTYAGTGDEDDPANGAAPPLPRPRDAIGRGVRWGGLFLSAVASLTLLAASVAFTGFVSEAMTRNDWVGWLATALAALATVSLAVIILRELVGILRLNRLSRLRRQILDALRQRDAASERQAVKNLKALFSSRPDQKWGLARLGEHEADIRDPGDLLALAERELIVPLDIQARRFILQAAKRVSVVTALSPMVWIAMIYVLVENLRLLRTLAGLYGGRPGFLGSFRLARMVVTHIIATGGLALTDDLLGQFLGQDLLRRLSRRLGEGVFNGALTARIGVAAIEVTRPLPFLEATPVRIRDLLPEIFRRSPAK